MDALRAGVSFFTTLRAGGDFDSLRKNLIVIPAVGAFIGILISIPAIALIELNSGFLIILAYVAVEGINHIDGLADFFDAVFAPPQRKLEALKDLNTGSGGYMAVSTYIVILAFFFSKMNILEAAVGIILAQVMAKQGMLHLMLKFNPVWEGILSEFTRFKRRKDYASYLFTALAVLISSVINPYKALGSVTVYLILLFFFSEYVRKVFGGINGDMVGALNCLIFAGVVGVWACLP